VKSLPHALALATLLALGAGVNNALAQDDAKTQAEQRVRLAARLIADSPAAQRIQASGNAMAVSHLDEGRLHLSLAEEALKAADYAKARKTADEALTHLGMARRLVPDAPVQQQALRKRHDEQLAAIERLVEAWRVRAGASAGNDNALLDATGLIGQARQQGESRRYDESLRTLAAAERRVLDGIGRALASRELDYSVRAGTPAETYHWEMARHSSLAELVPLAVRELQPGADARALIERYLQSAKTLHAQALQRFEGGDSASALATLRSASSYVERALNAAGVVTPNPSDGSGSN
jgi:hypothetical protein